MEVIKEKNFFIFFIYEILCISFWKFHSNKLLQAILTCLNIPVGVIYSQIVGSHFPGYPGLTVTVRLSNPFAIERSQIISHL